MNFDLITDDFNIANTNNFKKNFKVFMKYTIFAIHMINLLVFGLIHGLLIFEKPFHLDHFIIGIIVAIELSTGFMRSILMFVKRQQIRELLNKLSHVYSMEEQNNFDIKSILNSFLRYKYLSIVIFILTIIAGIIVASVRIKNNNNEYSDKLPLDMSNIIIYIVLGAWVHLAHTTFQIVNLIIGVFQYGLITLLSIEFHILANRFVMIQKEITQKKKSQLIKSLKARKEKIRKLLRAKTLISSMEHLENPPQQNQITLNDIKPLIERHNELFQLRDILEQVLHLSFLIKFVKSSILICALVFRLTINNEDQYFHFLDLLRIFVSILFQCYFGQMLKDASYKIAATIEQIGWETIDDCKMKRALKMILMRAQKSAELRIMKAFKISLEQFLMILNASYTYYALCLNVFKREM